MRSRAGADPNPAASMALLEEVLDPPVGPGYHSAAQARLAVGRPASSGTRTWLMLLVCITLGFLGAVSAMTLRAPDPVAAEGRRQLIERIEAAQAAGDEVSTRVDRLRGEILTLEQAVGEAQGGGEEITDAGRQAGAVAVHGPGVLIRLADAPSGDDVPGGEDQPGRVNARDLQLVVNGLWSAGAEAVAINGHRLTSTAAIRYAGEAVIVDFRGLTPPYEVVAVGDPARLDAEATAGFTGAYLDELRQQLGIQAEVERGDDVTVGPAERLTTRVATVPPGDEEDSR